MGLMLGLGALGVVVLLAAPFIARLIVGKGADAAGTTRIFQVLAVILLVAALLFRPHQDETAAFPPPPDAPRDR